MSAEKCLRCTGSIIGTAQFVHASPAASRVIGPLCKQCAHRMSTARGKSDYYSEGYRAGWNDALQAIADMTRRERKE